MIMSFIIIGTLIIFAFTFYGVLRRPIPRTIAAITGAIGMVLFGHAMGFYDPAIAIDYVDFNTIGLLLGMMILVGLLGETGFFRYIAVKTAKFSKGSYYRLLGFFVLVTAFTSAFLDNVTTVLLMTPITITIAEELDIDPRPFLMAGIMSANIGGAATLIGDPPNVVIGSAAGITFNSFILYLAPIVIIVLFVVLLTYELLYKHTLTEEMSGFPKIMDMDEDKCIMDRSLYHKSLFALSVTIILFTIHHIINLEPWLVAMTGASILLLLQLPDLEKALKHVHWATILFFASKFILVGGLDQAGVIDIIGTGMTSAASGSTFLALFIVLMGSALFTMVVGNIPAVITLIPAIQVFISQTQLFAAYPINPIWWALALGVGLGANGTLVGAHSNLVVSRISMKMGHPLSFQEYTKTGFPIAIFSLLLSFFLLIAFFVVLMG